MKKILRENKVLLLSYLLLILVLGAILMIYSKEEIHLFSNNFHSSVGDVFFKYLTYLGDGLAIVILFVLMLFVSFRKALIVGLSGFLSGFLAQFFKRIVFPDVVRPKLHFSGIAELYFVPGVDMHTTLSLPSGHTATAFALFFVLATFYSRRSIKILCLVGAMLVGYSRIYLSQHFLIDVYLGSLLGTISGILIVYLINRSHRKWLDLSLIKIFK
jgi:membrane-associated phospholipid phosphatase